MRNSKESNVPELYLNFEYNTRFLTAVMGNNASCKISNSRDTFSISDTLEGCVLMARAGGKEG